MKVVRVFVSLSNLAILATFKTQLLRKTSTSRISMICKSCADVTLFPMFNDNYGYIVTDPLTKISFTIDPGDGSAVINKLKESNIDKLAAILCTHKHNDHIGGNSILKKTYKDVEIFGTKYENIPEITKHVGHGDSFMLGSLKVTVYHTPCHTKGHVVYFITGSQGVPILFTGDTLFVGGCGRFFEGTADDMLKNMNLFQALPKETIVYCAHEYTENNIKFLATIDSSTKMREVLNEVQKKRKDGLPTVPTTLGYELTYNLFMKCHETEVQQLLNESQPNHALAKLRKLKNVFKG